MKSRNIERVPLEKTVITKLVGTNNVSGYENTDYLSSQTAVLC